MSECKRRRWAASSCSAAAVIWALGGCDTGKRAPPHDSAPARATGSARAAASAKTAREPLAATMLAAINRARAAEGKYLALRRAIMALAPFAHGLSRIGAEMVFGPPLASDEDAGALAGYDRALAGGDKAAAARLIEQIDKGLELIGLEIDYAGVDRARLLSDLSRAAYEVGLAALEAHAAVPDDHRAALEDLQGLLDGIGVVAGALGGTSAEVAEINARIATARALVGNRAPLVQESGRLGVAVRQLAAALGKGIAPPYPARYPVAQNRADEPVSAFTLPGPRVDLRPGSREHLADLGKKMFFDRRLSRGDRRACGDCHQPALAFSDGLRVAKSLDPAEPLTRNTPALLYTPLGAAQLWDGRLAGPERQALQVIHTRAEMGLSSRELEEKLAADADYARSFGDFPDGVTAANAARALVAYEVRELVPGKAAIDRFARGETDALDADARAGLEVFAGKGRCARCHIPPSFAGSRPIDFSTAVYAVLGVPDKPGGKELDGDIGRGAVTKRAIDRGAFKTPTLRNVDKTAPFFHHGRFTTLESVIDFYDQGGGAGAGLEVPNQDPEVRKLGLSAEEKKALLGFLRRTLAD